MQLSQMLCATSTPLAPQDRRRLQSSNTIGCVRPAMNCTLYSPNFQYYLMSVATGHAFGIRTYAKLCFPLHAPFISVPSLCRSDRIYVHMPMYHSAGGILGAGQMLANGCSVAILTKFSASSFWRDCVRYNCTASQYIGVF